MKVFWHDIIQFDLHNLKEASFLGEFECENDRVYLNILLSYLQEDIERLNSITINEPNLELMKKLREGILTREIPQSLVKEVAQTIESYSLKYRGEISFLLGYSYLRMKDYENSKKFYEKAYKDLNAIGAKRKAVKSYMNIAVADSRNHEPKRSIANFLYVAEKACEINDPIVQGLCLLNTSIEYQKLGAIELSLSYVNKAIELLKNDRGVSHFDTALSHRCHLYIELNRMNEALFDFQTLKSSTVIETKETVKAIQVLLGEKDLDIKAILLQPTWSSRLRVNKGKYSGKKISKLDSEFIELLSSGPKTKAQLLESIYGKEMDEEALNLRFKGILHSLRNKRGINIQYKNSQYFLENEVLDLPDLLEQA